MKCFFQVTPSVLHSPTLLHGGKIECDPCQVRGYYWGDLHIYGIDSLIFHPWILFFPFGSCSPGLWSSTKGLGLLHSWEHPFLGKPSSDRRGHRDRWLGPAALSPRENSFSFLGSSSFFQVVKTLGPQMRVWAALLLLVWAAQAFWAIRSLPHLYGQPRSVAQEGWSPRASFYHSEISCFHNFLVSHWKQLVTWNSGDLEFSADCLFTFCKRNPNFCSSTST